ncbi:C40 family peptidase [Atlantibacter hermannii]|uniref:C40 family peptidase n=1 Tax=Atlantibacter hermannii TaxID=565 RepID=UPI00289BA637|nr:NlpC/P60 family protein [Atlantibacter hermannii]
MVRMNKVSLTLCALFFTSLSFTPLALASEHARPSAVHKQITKTKHADKSSTNKTTTKKNTAKTTQSSKKTSATKSTHANAAKKTASGSKTSSSRSAAKSVAKNRRSAQPVTAAVEMTKQSCTKSRKTGKKSCVTVKTSKPTTIAEAHKVRVQKAQQTALNKLMGQIGKPYRWGGASPRTGFDCSGLIYYAYKDLVKFRIPRTANEMYHLRDASPVNVAELQSGDLVFFRTRGRGTADHVGVYVGNGKFIQSPRSGRDIEITSLSEDYWQRHYVGARRVMTPRTIR